MCVFIFDTIYFAVFMMVITMTMFSTGFLLPVVNF